MAEEQTRLPKVVVRIGALFRIAWAHRTVVIVPAVFAILGGAFVAMTFPPRYEATTRVMLDIIKPDPITGFSVSSKNHDAYVASQAQVVRDEDVTGRVVDAMGWASNPDMVAAWQAAPNHGPDPRTWAARQLSGGIGVDLVGETNILEIKFQSASPDLAKLVADNIRTAYVEATIEQQRSSARAGALSQAAQAERERNRLVELQAIKANLEHDSGILMMENGETLEGQRAMSAARTVNGHNPEVVVRRGPNIPAVQRMQLAQWDAALVEQAKTLGPNNPALIEMKRRRDMLASQVGDYTPPKTTDLLSQQMGMASNVVRDQAAKMLAQDDKRLALHIVQDEIKRRRTLLGKVADRAGRLSEISNVSDADLTPLGLTTVGDTPVFPNYPLIIGGCGALGLATGVLMAFLIEALERKIRSESDLRQAAVAPVIGVFPEIATLAKRRAKAARRARGRAPTPAAATLAEQLA